MADADALFNEALDELERTFRNSKRKSGSSNQFFPHHQKSEETAIMNSQNNIFASSNSSYSDNYHAESGNLDMQRQSLWSQIVDCEKTDEFLRFKLEHLSMEMIKNKKEIEDIKQTVDIHSSYSYLQSWQIQLLSEVSSMNLSYAHIERERLINQEKLRKLKHKYNSMQPEDSSESDQNSSDNQRIILRNTYRNSKNASKSQKQLTTLLSKPSSNDIVDNNKAFGGKRSKSEPDLGKMDEDVKHNENEAKNRCYTKDEVRLLKRELSCLMVNKMRLSVHRNPTDAPSDISENSPITINLKEIVIHPKLSEFLKYSIPDIIKWMKVIGFDNYSHKVNNHIRGPQHLLNLTSSELEKSLSMRNSLHRKKFLILLECVHRNDKPINHHFDVYATLNWLEIIGLPQYKTNFMENMIDGSVLTYLTGYNLKEIGVRNALHFLAIKWSLNRLHSNNFSMDCLSRTLSAAANDISSWSHSATCEWISTLDLKDFIPNLFGYGCPGVLMISEPLFTAESLADILKIPSSKTLLRRHLTIHFNNMVGSSVVSDKREFLISRKNHIVTTDSQIKDIKKRLPFNLAGKNYIFIDLAAPLILLQSNEKQ